MLDEMASGHFTFVSSTPENYKCNYNGKAKTNSYKLSILQKYNVRIEMLYENGLFNVEIINNVVNMDFMQKNVYK